MSKKQKNVKMNQKLLNVRMDQKFKKAFSAIMIGFIVTVLIAVTNIVMYANMANVNILTSHRGIIAIVLLIVVVGFNISLCNVVSKSLSASLVVPIQELQGQYRN